MSYQRTFLNASSSSKSKDFNFKDFEVLADREEQHWFKWAFVWNFLGISNIGTSNAKLCQCDKQGNTSLQTELSPYTMGFWVGPKNQQIKTENYLSVTGITHKIVNFRKDKSKVLKEHSLKDIAPSGFDARIEEIQK